MNFAYSDDHILLRDSAQSFVKRETDLGALLKPGATSADAPYASNWRKVQALGWPGLVIPEDSGGAGLDCIELAIVVAETGSTLFPSPLAGHVFGTFAVMAAASPLQQERWLPTAATGDVQLALVPPMDGNQIRVSGGKLTGSHDFVLDAQSAQILIVAARDANEGYRFYRITSDAPGVTISLQPWRDLTRQVSRVTLDQVEAEALTGNFDEAWPWVRDRIACYLAAENVGGMRTVLAETVRYANERVAFGKAIGSYQAIKHPLAEMMGAVESAATALLYASWALAEEDNRGSLAASMAKSFSSDAYVNATHRSIQIFGAIGFTWEMKNHLYFKRARANAQLFGDARSHREHVINLATGRTWSTPWASGGSHRATA